MEIIWRVINREEEGENEGKDEAIKKHDWQVQNRQGGVKNSIGNGEAKELICMFHGHELKEGIAGGKGVPGRGGQRRKNWDNCNNIINKIY